MFMFLYFFSAMLANFIPAWNIIIHEARQFNHMDVIIEFFFGHDNEHIKSRDLINTSSYYT